MNDRTITIQDPRRFDGNPYQVAERAIRQLSGLLVVALDAWEPTDLMLRNAELERQLALGNALHNPAAEWPESPQGSKLSLARSHVAQAGLILRPLERAAAYDPKAR